MLMALSPTIPSTGARMQEKPFKYKWIDLWKSKYGPKSSTSRHILIYLSTWMDEAGEGCYPSQERISKETGLSIRTISRHIEKLRFNGWLRKYVEWQGKKQKRNTYYPKIPKYVKKRS